MAKLKNIRAATAPPTPLPAPPAPAPRPAATSYNGLDTDDLATVERWVVAAEATRPPMAEDYNDWFKLCAAISALGEPGRVLFHRMSALSSKYDAVKTDAKFTNLLKTRTGEITLGTFFTLCKQAGVKPEKKPPGRPSGRKGQAEGLKDLQATLEETRNELAKRGASGKNVEEILAQVATTAMNAKPSDALTLFGRLEAFLQYQYRLRRNAVTRRIEMGNRPIDDSDVNDIYVAATKKVSEKIAKMHVEALLYSNFVETYNPITDYFENYQGLRVEGSIVRLANTIRTSTGFNTPGMPDPEFCAYFLTKWLIGIVASAHGDHSPLLLALTGGQGTGKTEWLRRLLPGPLQRYYAESKLDAGKDDEILMTQKLLICDDEMGGKSKRDETRLKELTSKAVFTLREPYGRANVDLHRLAVLCGTSNSPDLLNDPTGNRRIIPVDVLSIDHEAYNAIDKNEVLMEAYHLWKKGFTHHLNAEDIQRLGYQSGAFQGTVSERELIQVNLKVPDDSILPVEYLTNTEILEYLSRGQAFRLNPKVLGQQLKALGFERVSIRQRGEAFNRYCYAVIKVNTPVRPESNAPGF